MTAAAQRVRYRIGSLFARSPTFYLLPRRVLRRLPPHFVTRDTGLVIEGFPRSGNSFAVRAFRADNPHVPLAHHSHAPAQFIQAARWGIPTLCIVRQPEPCVRSLLVRRPEIGARTATRSWLAYHRILYRYRQAVEVHSFDETVSDFCGVMDIVNRRFGTAFLRFEHTPEAVDTLFRDMDRANTAAYGGRLRATHVPRPHPDREISKQEVDLAAAQSELSEANALYDAFFLR